MFAVDGLDEIQDIALDCIQVFKVNYREYHTSKGNRRCLPLRAPPSGMRTAYLVIDTLSLSISILPFRKCLIMQNFKYIQK